MDELLTKKDEYFHYTNDLTREMDLYLIESLKSKKSGRTYMYHLPIGENWLIRFPGATRGRIVVNNNEDMVIKSIELYDDKYKTDDIYEGNVRSIFKKYIGKKLIYL